jgi:hypothetical protein
VGSRPNGWQPSLRATARVFWGSLFYKNRSSPYSGLQVRASVARTDVRGETVYLDGEIVVEPGFGRHVRPGGIAAELALTGDT